MTPLEKKCPFCLSKDSLEWIRIGITDKFYMQCKVCHKVVAEEKQDQNDNFCKYGL